jgi:hypothetical protein
MMTSMARLLAVLREATIRFHSVVSVLLIEKSQWVHRKVFPVGLAEAMQVLAAADQG